MFSVMAVSCLTDLADGKIARQFHMVSQVGKVLDPLA
ncbi:MAG: CDP-alcohol phosphatidyltransferase family protein, partial [Oscillospiraceae bacterium]|nr:CDP-alcohol phosphatidyltransferase family protein [Oscillospiraceae bacterium]